MPADGGAVRLAFLYAVEISALERDGVDRPKFFANSCLGVVRDLAEGMGWLWATISLCSGGGRIWDGATGS